MDNKRKNNKRNNKTNTRKIPIIKILNNRVGFVKKILLNSIKTYFHRI